MKVPRSNKVSIKAVFAEGELPAGLARISLFDGAIERVINPSGDSLATFHGLPPGTTRAVVRVNGVFAGQQEITIPDEDSLDASVRATSAVARGQVHNVVLRFVQCNIFYSGKGTDKYHALMRSRKDKKPWEGAPIRHLAHNLKNFTNLAVIGLQEVVDTDQEHQKGLHVRAIHRAIQEQHVSGERFSRQQREVGVKQDAGKYQDRLGSGIAVLWRKDLVERRNPATLLLDVIEGYRLRATGGLFVVKASGRSFAFFTCKLRWRDSVLEDHVLTRMKEARTLVEKVQAFLRKRGIPRTPVILCMDMNDEPSSPAFAVFRDAGYVPAGTKNSSLAHAPNRCIDYIWYRHTGGLGRGLVDEEHVSENIGSDHLFKWVDISI